MTIENFDFFHFGENWGDPPGSLRNALREQRDALKTKSQCLQGEAVLRPEWRLCGKKNQITVLCLCRKTDRRVSELLFNEYCVLATTWLQTNA